nr:MAG TPA: hypothetical protein [Caudoviricetes sp.]
MQPNFFLICFNRFCIFSPPINNILQHVKKVNKKNCTLYKK